MPDSAVADSPNPFFHNRQNFHRIASRCPELRHYQTQSQTLRMIMLQALQVRMSLSIQKKRLRHPYCHRHYHSVLW